MRKPTIVLAILFLFGCSAFAQGVYTPEKGTPERKEILDALRLPVERELKQKIVFAADTFNVLGNWTFIFGTMRSPEGGQPDFSRTKYAQAQRDGLSSALFAATTRIAAYDWDLPPVKALLREVSSAMSDETELLQGLSAPGQRALRPARTSPDMLAGRQ